MQYPLKIYIKNMVNSHCFLPASPFAGEGAGRTVLVHVYLGQQASATIVCLSLENKDLVNTDHRFLGEDPECSTI